MRLDEVIRGIAITDRRGIFDAEISGLSADSRRVGPGQLFVAVRGVSQDGHDHIPEALRRGALGVMGEAWPESADEIARANVVLVPNARRALALAAANFYGQPSRKLLVAGVTGTNGKTTVTYVLESIIRAASKKVGVIGTVDCRYGNKTLPLAHTTPDAVTLQATLGEMVDAGVSHVAMEVSSHALDQERVAGLHFKVAGFTNFSQDHLDYHGDLDTYFEAKARLFSEFLRKSRARGRMAVVNVDDPKGAEIVERWGGKTLKVSLDPKSDADLVALEAHYGLDGIKATVRTSKGVWEITSPLIGPHNLNNILVAMGMALAMGFSKQRILRGLEQLERVPGRLDRVPDAQGRAVFVDYAHTPDALSKAISALRPLVKGRLIVVFGCGGDRDQHKRDPMGRAVAAGADAAVVTNDNPRNEDPKAIAQAVEKGLLAGGFTKGQAIAAKTFVVELDRRHAIRLAIEAAGPDDAVLIAGKGHENYQIVGKEKHRFEDRDEARRILAGEPPPPPMVFEDATGEVTADQVEDALEILAEAPASALPVTQSVDPSSIVDEVDMEPDIVAEEADEDDLVMIVEESESSEGGGTGDPPAPQKT
ncbi:MAG: UDP-N-acetylmuramoyl-L-alanyl-D-glutamate--2,6-diaminopimelate ligase [Myxococcales bacterium]|nr:UDP-N-acetylmuramoyl-L-alanyl-D-glutamate--2,6-diaminopimelate ligase [Myxococcales bacterium]